MCMENRRCHKLSVGTAKARKRERKKVRDREESRDRGCPHYLKHLIQIKEIRLDFKETKNMASSKVKTYFCSPPSAFGVVEALAASTVTITSLSIDAASPRANLLVCPPVHCFPREGLTGFIYTLGRGCASGSDMPLTRRGMCRTWVWLTCSPTHCHTGHTLSDIETLEPLKHNVHRRLSVLQASLSVFGPLYGNVWQQDHLFVACVRMSSVSTEGSCKAKSSGTFIRSAPK